MMLRTLILAAAMPTVAAAQLMADPPLARARIILVGDSTMAVNSGWGPGFCPLFDGVCVNMAKGGRSSGSYRAEGSWAKVIDELEPWAAATRKVAEEENVPLLDLNAESVAAIDRMGPAEANTLAMAPAPVEVAETAASGNSVAAPKIPASPGAPVFDYTHLGAKGSAYFGRTVADELGKGVPELQALIKR